MDGNVPVSSSDDIDTQRAGVIPKMSFASVAAMPRTGLASSKPLGLQTGTIAIVSAEGRLSSSLANLNIQGHGSNNLDNLQYVPKLDDERTHISISSVQAPSVASGLAFTLDEKESIRPDDSASVQAAEDDDSNSGPGSGAQNSRFGSEAGGKPFHSQLREISIQRRIPYAPKIEDHQEPTNTSQFSYWMPDDKLLEALDSAKDRLFLLQLEQQIIAFIQSPVEGSFDLPPYNSFLRLLAHRLADYYKLNHFVDGPANTVRLYKSPTIQLPTPLSAFRPGALSEEVPQIVPSLKIMRRLGADGHLAESGTNTDSNSMVPSKATSEGSDHDDGIASPAESSTTKDKTSQSREQREAKYKEARDRIFADWKEENEKDGSNNVSEEASRASSVTGKRKKKKTKDQDDGFEARSAFYRQQPFDPSIGSGGYFVPYMVQQPPTIPQQSYTPLFQPQYPAVQQAQMIPAGIVPAPVAPMMYQQPIGQQYTNYGIPQQQIMGPYYPIVPQQPQPLVQYPQQFIPPSYAPVPVQTSRPSSQVSNQSWNQSSTQNQYPGFMMQPVQYSTPLPQPIPQPNSNGTPITYPYGQLPYQSHPPGSRNAHPLPGSYSRQNYSAQTRVFVPANQSGYNMADQVHSSGGPIPQNTHPQQQMQFAYQQQIPLSVPQSQYIGPTYGSPNSTSSRKHTPHAMPTPPSNTLSKWGVPSTLPPKPPPPVTIQLHDPGMSGRKSSGVGTTGRHAP